MVEGSNKKIKSKLTLLICVSLIFSSTQLKAQFGFYTGFDSYLDDNIYNNYLGISDHINSLSFGAGYNFESSWNNLEFYYDGILTRFSEESFKSSNSHKAGIVNSFLISGSNPLNIGANYSLRNYEDGYDIYNLKMLSLYANYRQYTDDNDFILIGYIFNRTKYPNLETFSYNEHKGFIKYRLGFSSKTSLLLGMEANHKDYIQKFKQSNSINNALQLSSFIQLAQSLGESTGLSLFAQARKNIKDGTRSKNWNEYIYYEEELLNDRYSNDGYEGGIKLTQMLIPTLILSGSVNYAKRNYTNLPAADLDGNSFDHFREDDNVSYGVQLEASLGSILPGLYGDINWNYVRNNSNDPFYNYNNQVFSAGLEFSF
jgi:hypothetical protein